MSKQIFSIIIQKDLIPEILKMLLILEIIGYAIASHFMCVRYTHILYEM